MFDENLGTYVSEDALQDGVVFVREKLDDFVPQPFSFHSCEKSVFLLNQYLTDWSSG